MEMQQWVDLCRPGKIREGIEAAARKRRSGDAHAFDVHVDQQSSPDSLDVIDVGVHHKDQH